MVSCAAGVMMTEAGKSGEQVMCSSWAVAATESAACYSRDNQPGRKGFRRSCCSWVALVIGGFGGNVSI